jgi:hypothetical protein
MTKIGAGLSIENPKFVRKSDGLHADVCKDIKKPINKVNNILPDSSVHHYHKIVLVVPDEYAFALMDMYGKGLQHAIMQLIKTHVKPLEKDE